MSRSRIIRILLVSLTVLTAFGTAGATELFRDEMDSAAGWGVNANNADSVATFGYDYSADDIPEAPNSRGGDVATTGVKLEANLALGASSVLTIYPTGQSFTGDYQLRFDAWMNYFQGGDGTTEFVGGSLGYDGTSADVNQGAECLITGDGGSGSDWRAYAEGAFLDASEMTAGSRNGADPYYADFLPGVAPPPGQAQTSFAPGADGSPGFQWITVEINSVGGVCSIVVEKPGGARLEIVHFNHDAARPYTNDGNIGLRYADYFTSVTTRPDLTFGLIDNVEVNDTPVPVSLQTFTVE